MNRLIWLFSTSYAFEKHEKNFVSLGELENRVLRKIFAHEREEVTGEWRRLYH
jgi:hypothetical protein